MACRARGALFVLRGCIRLFLQLVDQDRIRLRARNRPRSGGTCDRPRQELALRPQLY
jgi:hypothetical protein